MYVYIIPGGILSKFYVYKGDNTGKFVKTEEFPTEQKLGQAVVYTLNKNTFYFTQVDGDLHPTMKWIVYDVSNPAKPY